jgi:hypothetical protein
MWRGDGMGVDDFALEGVDDRTYSLADVRGPKGTLVVFIATTAPIVAEVKALT